jgi:hypothetical protein
VLANQCRKNRIATKQKSTRLRVVSGGQQPRS